MADIRLNLATVNTPTATYIKARATLGDSKLTVMDRRSVVLETVDAERADTGPGKWSYGADITVLKTTGCACGGTRVVKK